MVCLIHHQHVPARIQHLCGAHLVTRQEIHRSQHPLTFEKRIAAWIPVFDRFAPLLVEEAEGQLEPPQQLHEPLMHQRLGHQDQHPLRPAGEDQAVEDQARFDRFSQPHLIRQQHPRPRPVRHLIRDEKLVRDQIHPRPRQPAHRRGAHHRPPPQRLAPQVEIARLVQLPAEKPLLRFAETDGV